MLKDKHLTPEVHITPPLRTNATYLPRLFHGHCLSEAWSENFPRDLDINKGAEDTAERWELGN